MENDGAASGSSSHHIACHARMKHKVIAPLSERVCVRGKYCAWPKLVTECPHTPVQSQLPCEKSYNHIHQPTNTQQTPLRSHLSCTMTKCGNRQTNRQTGSKRPTKV